MISGQTNWATLRDMSEMETAGTRYGTLPKPLKVFYLALVGFGIVLAVFYTFGFTFIGGPMLDYSYYWLFMAIFISCIFLILPARKRDQTIPWYDVLAMAFAAAVCFYNYMHAWEMSATGWDNVPAGIIVLLLIFEGARRGAGNIFFAVVLGFSAYPVFADYMPGLLWGKSFSPELTLRILIFRHEGLLGLPLKVMAEFLVGFLVFAAVLLASGGGEFFLKLACSLVGKYRGGPAKVAVIASGFFGMMSGSAVSNVAATGSFTIPTMKRLGYPPHYAGAIEACASTGGMLMPPVMGAVAFIMCEFLQIEYGVVIKAAALPAILYYFGLLMQVDGFAARAGLIGMPKEEIPPLRETLKEGWPFLIVLLFLIWGLIYMRWEGLAPWYASGLVFILSFCRRETWMTPKRIGKTLTTIGIFIVRTTAVVLPIGLIMGGLTITGVSGSFTAGIVDLGGGNALIVFILGAVACYIMGMAGLVSAAYVFLAVTLAPAVLKMADLNVLAVHLFILYYSMLACITPPVATAVFVGAAMAGAPVMKTGFLAMRLGIVIYFIPFFFIWKPALIFQGPLVETLYLLPFVVLGILLLAGGAEGYLIKVGRVDWWARPFLVISGFLISLPEWKTTVVGVIAAFVVLYVMVTKRRTAQRTYRLAVGSQPGKSSVESVGDAQEPN